MTNKPTTTKPVALAATPSPTADQVTKLYLDMHLPRMRARLSSQIIEMQQNLAMVANDITRYGTSTKTNTLPNLLADILSLHERIAVMIDVEKIQRDTLAKR